MLGLVLMALIFLIVFSIVVAKKVKDAFSPLRPKSRSRRGENFAREDVSFGGGHARETKKQKVFDDDEGEYVDYEEIK